MKVVANGIKNSRHMEVVYDNGVYTFNDTKRNGYEAELKDMLSMRYPIGGTYCPDKDDVKNLINVLSNYFFDERTDDIVIEGNVEPLPLEAGEDGVY